MAIEEERAKYKGIRGAYNNLTSEAKRGVTDFASAVANPMRSLRGIGQRTMSDVRNIPTTVGGRIRAGINDFDAIGRNMPWYDPAVGTKISNAFEIGGVGAAIGQGIRGLPKQVFGVGRGAVDAIVPDPLANLNQKVGTGIVNAVSTAATGSPAIIQPPPAQAAQLPVEPVNQQIPTAGIRRPDGPQVPAGIGEGFPGTGMIKDSTGKVSYMDASGNISSFRPYQEGGVRNVQPQLGGGIRRGNYNFEGSAEDAALFNKPVFNNATRQVVSGTRVEAAPHAAGVTADPLTGSFGEVVMQGLGLRRARTLANIENQQVQADLERSGQGITARGQDLTFASNAEQNAIAAGRNPSLNALAAAQGELVGTQADIAKRSTELFNQWQAAPEGPEKEQLKEAYNMLQGTQEKAPQIHFGETESITDQGIVSTPYAATLDQQGGLRVLRQGANSLEGAARPAPKVGDIVGGYKFKGGDPKSKDSWEKI